MWFQQIYNQNMKDLRGRKLRGRLLGSLRSGRAHGDSVPPRSQSGGGRVTLLLLRWPGTFPHGLSTVNFTLLPQLICPVCSSGTLQQCLPAQLHSVPTEISNNVCWPAVCFSEVVSYSCRLVSPQKSTQLQVLFRTKLRNLWTNSFAQLFICFCINFLYFFIQYDATQLKCVNLNGNNLCFVNAVCHFVELVFMLLLLFSHFFLKFHHLSVLPFPLWFYTGRISLPALVTCT